MNDNSIFTSTTFIQLAIAIIGAAMMTIMLVATGNDAATVAAGNAVIIGVFLYCRPTGADDES